MINVAGYPLKVWHDLDPACSVADDGHSLACGVEIRIPVRGVSQVAFVVLNSWVLWESPVVEMANGW